MKKKYFILGFVALLFVSACCIFSGQYVSNGCFWWECAPERDFRVLDWEIPISLFPDGAFTDHITIPTDNMVGEIEGGSQTIYLDTGVAVYIIYRFPSVKESISQWESDKKAMFDPETSVAWLVPDSLTFSSATADDLYTACGYFYQYRCEAAVRYQEYAVFFGADINDKMTFAQFEKILFYIDEQISSRLYP